VRTTTARHRVRSDRECHEAHDQLRGDEAEREEETVHAPTLAAQDDENRRDRECAQPANSP
jgi:hypothetical protein